MSAPGASPPLRFRVNGQDRSCEGVPDDERLLDTVRWRLGLKGTKEGCRTGDCGACTLLVNGRSTLSCLTLAHEAEGKEVETVEGLASSPVSQRIEEAFARAGAVQCGYCTPGFVAALEGLLRERQGQPVTASALLQELGGNLCRCTGYYGILRALSEVLGEPVGSPGPPMSRSAYTVGPASSAAVSSSSAPSPARSSRRGSPSEGGR